MLIPIPPYGMRLYSMLKLGLGLIRQRMAFETMKNWRVDEAPKGQEYTIPSGLFRPGVNHRTWQEGAESEAESGNNQISCS